jgi:hypothetical protein
MTSRTSSKIGNKSTTSMHLLISMTAKSYLTPGLQSQIQLDLWAIKITPFSNLSKRKRSSRQPTTWLTSLEGQTIKMWKARSCGFTTSRWLRIFRYHHRSLWDFKPMPKMCSQCIRHLSRYWCINFKTRCS